MAPPGLVYAGRIRATASGTGNDTKIDQTIFIPTGVKLDRTFSQPGGLVTSGGGAASALASGDIPKGWYVECSGSDTNGHRWAVLKPYSGGPIQDAVGFDDNDEVTQWKFTLGLYADAGEKPFAGGATTSVDVYYKSR